MITKKRWTMEEEEIIVKAIKANPHNLSEAFRKAAKKLGRTENAVSYRWYTKTRLNSVCFITVSQSKEFKNGKNYIPNSGHINSPTSLSKTLWKKIKTLLGF